MKELRLFYFDGCPFCNKVRKYMSENDIEVEMVDIKASAKNRDELVNVGGKAQVPCLFVDGTPLYESDDIIQWFKENM